MRKQFIIILLTLLVAFGLMVSCKNEVPNAGFGEELVSVSFKEDTARGLTATLEGFDKDHLYWAYAAQKADGSQLISGQTANYGQPNETRVWIKTDSYNNPVAGLGTTGSSGYEAYKVSGFSQGYWNFKLYAYKGVLGDNPATTEIEEDDFITGYVLVYQGETLNALLKSDSANTQGSHLVSVIVDPIQSQDNGTMVFLTNKSHLPADRISMNTVNSAIYGTNYTVKVLSILSIGEIPVEYVDTAAEEQAATDGQDGLYNLPAGSYKVTVAFTDSASAPTVNYAKGTIVATVYSNLTTTISGDLTEAMTYAEFDGELNPDLETVTASNDQPIVKEDDPTKTVVLTTNTSAAKEVTATIKAGDTNKIINNMADTAGTNTDAYNQNLNLTLSVETVETTATTATYEIGMTAELKSIKISDQSTTTTTSDVSEVDEYVRVEVQLETGLTAVNVLHDGLQMVQGLENPDPNNVGKFAYNAVLGVLTIETKSFSPFSVSFTKPDVTTYVAQVGNVKYQSLAAAISAAKTDGTDTITLLNDVSLLSATVINKKVVLDLAGYTIAAEAGLTASVAETTIKNGSIVGALTVSGSNIGLSAVTVTGSVDVSGSAAFDSDCSVTGTDGVASAINATGSIAIEGGTYAAAEGENKYILSGNATISDGNFKGKLAPSDAENIVLTGGTYSEMQVASRLAQGCECVEISDGVYMVRNIVEAVNVRTGVKYHYLQNAIDAASAGDTVKLLRNITLKSGIVITKGITLDGDGYSITAVRENMSFSDDKVWNEDAQSYKYIKDETGLQAAIIVYSNDVSATQTDWMTTKVRNLTVNTTNVMAVSFLQYVNGEADHVTISSEKNRGISAGNASSNSVSVKVTDCTVNESGQASPSAWNSTAVAAMCGAEIEIDGGSYNGYYGIYIYSSGGRIVVNESEGKTTSITGTSNAVRHDNWTNPNSITEFDINGGSFDGKINLETNQPVANVRISISDGSFTHFSYQYDSFGDFITGGTFDADPSAYVVPGYEAIYDESTGLWTVEKILAVSIVRGTEEIYYGNFEEAYAEVESGDKMVVLRDCTASYHDDNAYDFTGKDITIHVNEGATLACGDVTNGKFEVGWSNEAGTLTLEGPGRITFDSNNNWGLITQNGSGSDIIAIVKEVTIEASSANGYVMEGGNLKVESGYFKNIAFAAGTRINGGYFTTDVSDCGCIIPEGKMCGDNPDYPASSEYPYFITDLDPAHANFSLLHGEDYSYFLTLDGVNSAAVSGDTITFIGSDLIINVDSGDNKFSVEKGGVIYDLNGHTIEATPSAYAFYMGIGSKTITMKNGTINATNKLCEDNSIYTFTVIATNLTINDAIRESALSHINNGVYVYENSEYFTVRDDAPESYKAELVSSDVFFFTGDYAVADAIARVGNGETINVKAELVLEGTEVRNDLVIGNKFTVIKQDNVNFPDATKIKTKTGKVNMGTPEGNTVEYTVVESPVCEIWNGNTKIAEYTTLKEAWDSSNFTNGTTIKLLEDITISSSVSTTSKTSGKTYRLDFNGHKITCTGYAKINMNWNSNSTSSKLYFVDSVGGGGIFRESPDSSDVLISHSKQGNIIVEGGIFECLGGNPFNINASSVLTINAGTIKCNPFYENTIKGKVASGHTIILNGVSYTAP